MGETLHILTIDGYPKADRDYFKEYSHPPAAVLYDDILKKLMPGLQNDILYIADPGQSLPVGAGLEQYDGIIWTGSKLTIFDDIPEVRVQIGFARQAFEAGCPSFGSCWGVQMAAVAAGGEVKRNPRGREMGIARKIRLTPEGRAHPMYEGKPEVFNGFIMHLDEVTSLPAGAVLLAENGHTPVQALSVKHGKGTFWATQYHPEYDLHNMALLMNCRRDALVQEGFFASHDVLDTYRGWMETLSGEPDRKDLRWLLALDDDLVKDEIRQLELKNWLVNLVIPSRS